MNDFELVAPATKRDVLALLADADEDTRLIAGGTGLLNLIKQRLASPARLISLHRVPDLAGVHCSEERIVINALERLIDIENNREIGKRLPILRDVLREVASPRIRSMATLGGAIAHGDPNEDLPLAFLAADAVVMAESAGGVVEIPIDEFYKDYYETVLTPAQLITGISIPVPAAASRFAYKKFTPASSEDYACVGVCIRLDLDSTGSCGSSRIVLGSLGPTAFRAKAAEQLLNGNKLTPELADRAARTASEATDPIDDTRGTAAYKRKVTEVWVRRLLTGMART